VSDCFVVATPDDTHVESLICDNDHRNIVNKDLVSKMLLAEHGIQMRCVVLFLLYRIDHDMMSSSRTVVRRRKAYGLLGSGATTRAMPLPEKRQPVLNQLAKDPNSRQGPKMIGEGIVLNKGVHLNR
jgi:hypothetical protein